MCEYCKSNTEFIPLNTTTDYSGLEFALCGNMLRVRYSSNDYKHFESQDIVIIKHCPMCGRRLEGTGNVEGNQEKGQVRSYL